MKDTPTLSLAGANEDAAATGDLDITDDLTITGNGARRTIIDGGGAAVNDRVFHVDPAGAGIQVSISGVTIQNGNVSGNGGGILNDGKAGLTMDRVIVTANSAVRGGGVFNGTFATAALTKTVISGNRGVSDGGMVNQGIATLNDVAISGNTVSDDTAGIFIGGAATLSNVTISGNTAGGAGAGLAPFAGGMFISGNATLINVTISGNTGDPGAIWNGGHSTLINVTINGNTGGIRNHPTLGSITLTNTIVANSPFIFNLNCQGPIISHGHNLDSGNSCGFTSTGDIVNADPLLGPLAYSVGRTQTHALLPSSPAIDAGDNAGCPSTDQRGVRRPQGAACEIGAHELQLPTFVVNNTHDLPDSLPGDGVCETSSPGICSLRAAIMEANAFAGPDLITFRSRGALLTIAGANEDAAATGDLDIREDVTIVGNGTTKTIIDGGGTAVNDRVFHVDPTGTGITVSISDVMIQNGNAAPAPDGGGILNSNWLNAEATRLILTGSAVNSNSVSGIAFNRGGGIANNGHLEVTNSTIAGNSASVGGGIDSLDTATAVLTGVTVSDNKARSAEGGGIYNNGTMTLIGSTVRHNMITGTPPLTNGGGIFNNDTLSLIDSTIDGNTAPLWGGGIWNDINAVATLTNTTVSANIAAAGGGIYNNQGHLTLVGASVSSNSAIGPGGGGITNNSGTLNLTNSTISGNTGNLRAGGINNSGAAAVARLLNVTVNGNTAGAGGGISNTGAISLKNTIIANSAPDNCSGAITSNGHNLDSGATCGFAIAQGDLVGANPLLGPLANNGGATQTHVLLAGSPAIDAGDNAGCPPADQRGVSRPQGPACDIGAYERAPVTPVPPSVPFADKAFRELWERTDLPIAVNAPGLRPRSWLWGPQALASAHEPYAEGPDGSRLVQYFDKGRMEINHPDAPRDRWYVTSGLLVSELIEGRAQAGDTAFADREPADEAVAGDPAEANPAAPTYRSFRGLVYPLAPQPAPRRGGELVTAVLAKDGGTYDDPNMAHYNVTIDAYDEQLGHNIPRVFTTFFAQQGLVYEGGRYRRGPIIDWLFVMGLPISEPYWARVKVGGVEKDVLMQAFQRRVLTYTPDNPPDWRVEMGNVGLHYLRWRDRR